jgi:alkanesulfonate monooxygenase SsuD/methylene tetrahydromethanopterin reductase-like flavin-dependent oxidoreductase (luciferase family)
VPLYLGYQGPKGAGRAGRLGEGLLSIDRSLLAPYLAGLAEGGHPPSRAVMSGNVPAFVSEDPERDWPVVSEHLRYQLDSYRRYLVEGTDQPVPRPVDPQRVISSRGSILGSCIYGTPELVADEIRAVSEGCPVDTVFFMASLAGMPEDLTARTVSTICTRLAPLLRGSQPCA